LDFGIPIALFLLGQAAGARETLRHTILCF
jgi:hypothetical protein